jgi:hypothetical protein
MPAVHARHPDRPIRTLAPTSRILVFPGKSQELGALYEIFGARGCHPGPGIVSPGPPQCVGLGVGIRAMQRAAASSNRESIGRAPFASLSIPSPTAGAEVPSSRPYVGHTPLNWEDAEPSHENKVMPPSFEWSSPTAGRHLSARRSPASPCSRHTSPDRDRAPWRRQTSRGPGPAWREDTQWARTLRGGHTP